MTQLKDDFKIENITPAKAANMLKHNMKNRHLTTNNVKYYAKQMESGQWKVNGESIKFSKNGFLFDGQHRLQACILSGVPFETWVHYNLDESVFDTLDTGKNRSARDILSIKGEKNTSILASSLRVIFFYDVGGMKSKGRLSNIDIELLLDEHPSSRDSAHFAASNKNGILSGTDLATFHYLFNRSDSSLCEDFFEKVVTGIGLDKNCPELVLRNRLIANNGSKSSKLEPYVVRGLIVKAWNAAKMGTEVKLLRFSMGDDFPEIL